MLRHSRHQSFDEKLQHLLQSSRFFKHIKLSRELYLLAFFSLLFFILVVRLFFLQIINHTYYDQQLNQQQVSETSLQAKRGNIYADDKASKHIQLTDNISLYNIYIDPKFVRDKERVIDALTPVLYQHLCGIYGMEEVMPLDCIKHVELFTQKQLLPVAPEFFYYGSGIISSGYFTFDRTGYNIQVQNILSGFTTGIAYGLIKDELNRNIYVGIKPKNYLGFFANTDFLAELEKLNLPYIDIQSKNYVYVVPTKIGNVARESLSLKKLLDKYGYMSSIANIDNLFVPQENRYVKLASDVNPLIAQMVKDLELKYYRTQSNDKIPLLHGLGLEETRRRYYQYGSFLSNVLWFVDKNGVASYGLEQYFDSILRGKDGKIVGRTSAWVGPVGANEFDIADAQDGNDMYLTIDVGIQKEIETIIKPYYDSLKADSISVLVYDPMSWHIIASANYPSYNPNNYNDAFQLQPLGPDHGAMVDDISYVEVPVFIFTWWAYRPATTSERWDVTIPKYIARNIYGSQALIDNNISRAYEPGSVFKAFTVAIGLDTDEIRFYDPYTDPNKVQVGQFWIKNADPKFCGGDWNFLHAFVFSCNVGMVRIAQRLGKESFYNYVDKLHFWKQTGIELANEDAGFVEGVTSVSDARFFNNTFGQGLLVTPLQLAVWYGALVNGWYYVQPTIVKWVFDTKTQTYHENTKKVLEQIFSPETSEALKTALFDVIDQNAELKYAKVEWYNLGGKSWTSQISYKGKYMQGIWWTNGSFIGLITKDDPKYIVVIQVRRPRSNIWWWFTAGKIFWDIAKFILSYSLIEK